MFPTQRLALNDYFGLVINYLTANASRLGISGEQLSALSAAHADWSTVFIDSVNSATRTAPIIKQRNAAGNHLKALLRATYRDIPASALNNTDRNTLHLFARSATYQRAHVPQSAPLGQVAFGDRLQHRVAFLDSGNTVHRRRPEGVKGCEIWLKIGDVAQDEKELRYVGMATRSPHTVHFEGADKGKQAHYWLRWINTRGAHGPWSEPLEATIAG